MLIRLFGLFGLLLAAGYLIEGLAYLIRIVRALPYLRDVRPLAYLFVTMSLDLFIALALFIAGVGLLFAQRWARKMWLITMSILTLLHFLLIILRHLGNGVSGGYVVWSILVILLTALSWWYFYISTPNTVPQENGSPENPQTQQVEP